mgnify:CR=1 FL=1|tara:strand:- start:1239 stop:1793 length:555 start_codon:yes stop_codon:yes gene_type:complete
MPKKIVYTKPKFTFACAFAGILLLLLSTYAQAEAQESNELFTIYLVRHSEKQSLESDPPLTKCGVQRSESLSALFEAVPIEALYSTEYKRTQSTALPTSIAKDLAIQSYEPQALEEIARQLLHAQQDALVVGHSNTTAVLAGILVGEKMGSFDESIYNRIYQVVISKDDRRLHILHTAFQCAER